MLNKYFYEIAQLSAKTAAEKMGLTNINPEWIYCQYAHETGNFTSELMECNHNLGGMCQTEPNGTPQPDGDQYYMNFESFESYANYFGVYLGYYIENGIDKVTTLEEYIIALKDGGYFGATLEEYIDGCTRVWNECFSEE